MSKKQLWFDFIEKEEDAIKFCEEKNKKQSYYMRKHHPVHYTPWEDSCGYKCFVVWRYI